MSSYDLGPEPERPNPPQPPRVPPRVPPGAPGSPYAPAPQEGGSGLAITSMILGIVGLCLPLANIAGIICGAISLSKGRPGKGMALTGVILGSLGVVFSCMIPILLPSLNRARETANRVKCSSNMRQIALGAIMYASDNRGKFPATLDDILRTQDIKADAFNCPSTNDSVAPGADNKQQAANLDSGGHLSYVYVGSKLNINASSDCVLLYEPMTNHSDGINVAFTDAHIEWFAKPQAQQIIADLEAGKNPPRTRAGPQ